MPQDSTSQLDPLRKFVRKIIRQFAKLLNWLSGGKLTPNMVTAVGLLAHIPIAWLIATRHNFGAAILLIIFGLFDTLDGELARLQKSESDKGMLFDAVSDRFKEVVIYGAIAYNLISLGHAYLAVWTVIACGASLLVSYVKARGEVAYLNKHGHSEKINDQFKGGFMRFEVRMVIIILGLLTNYLGASVIIIAIFASYTAISRLLNITKNLDVQD